MRRRTFVEGLLAGTAVGVMPAWGHKPAIPTSALDELKQRVGERLIPVRSPLVEIARRGGEGGDDLFHKIKNPYFLGDEPGLAQTLGWTDAWTFEPSIMAVAAESAADVAAAVVVARKHRLRLVVKGGGHSYFGNSNAVRSLLVWTRRMDGIEMHDAFRPQGAPADAPAQPAASIGAGAIWGRVYDAVAVRGGRYIQGGGCLTVGVAGFVQGGGFGSLSKAFGTGAANLIEAEVVTADGRIRIVNRYRKPELFFALRGGGGGTFGVVTRLTLRTHALPEFVGAALFEVKANSERAWRTLVARIVDFYSSNLFGPIWGEQLRFSPGRRLQVSMLCHGLDQQHVEAAWRPFVAWIGERPSDFAIQGQPTFLSVPGRKFWDADFLRALSGVVLGDDRAGAPEANVFWASNLSEAGQVLYAYQSAWLPAALLRPARQKSLVDALISASSEWSVTLHTNKGLAGGSRGALAATAETATNPEVLEAFALLICAAEGPSAWPGIPGHRPDLAEGRLQAAGVARAMAPIRALVPNAGAYVSEADYFDRDWKRMYWGAHYPRLAAAKRRYDPAGLFRGHHCVEFS